MCLVPWVLNKGGIVIEHWWIHSLLIVHWMSYIQDYYRKIDHSWSQDATRVKLCYEFHRLVSEQSWSATTMNYATYLFIEKWPLIFCALVWCIRCYILHDDVNMWRPCTIFIEFLTLVENTTNLVETLNWNHDCSLEVSS